MKMIQNCANIRSTEELTKRSSNTILCLVSFSAEQTLNIKVVERILHKCIFIFKKSQFFYMFDSQLGQLPLLSSSPRFKQSFLVFSTSMFDISKKAETL